MLPYGFCLAQDTQPKSKWQAEVYGGVWFNNKSFSQPSPEELFNEYIDRHEGSFTNSDGLGFDYKNEQFYSVTFSRKFSLPKIKRINLALGLGLESYVGNFYTVTGYRQRLEDLRGEYYIANFGNVSIKHSEAWDTIALWRRYSNVLVAWKIKVMIRIIGSVKFNVALTGSFFNFPKWQYYANYDKNKPKEPYREEKGTFRFNLNINSLPIYFSGNLFKRKRSNFEWELGLVHPIIKRPMILIGTNYNF